MNALGIELDALLDEETKTLNAIFEAMHGFWKSYVIETDFDLKNFEKCYSEEVKTVKEAYEMVEIIGGDAKK